MPWIEVHLAHGKEPQCEASIEVELEWIDGEIYGTDADGNRGVWVPGYLTVASEVPEVCSECGHHYLVEELKALEADAEKAAEAMTMTADDEDA